MLPEKYRDMGFEITKFGATSLALRYGRKPVFVYSSRSNTDIGFITHICDTYLKISEKRKNLTCVRTA
jgi:hypothetical protein